MQKKKVKGRKDSVELVSVYCPTDCMYRASICGGYIPICYYCVSENVSTRGCKISECDKYKPGIPIKPRMDGEYVVWWEYGEDDNSVW